MKSTLISSEDNAVFKNLLKLKSSRGIDKQDQFLLFGERVVSEWLRSTAPVSVVGLISSTAMPHSAEEIFSSLGANTGDARTRIAHFILGTNLFAQIDLFGTKAPILICERPELPVWSEEYPAAKENSGPELWLALGDPTNVGACLRSAHAFGASRVVLTKEAATPFHPKSVRAASGSLLRVPIFRGPSVHELKGTSLVGLDLKGESIYGYEWPPNAKILIGEEGLGIPNDRKIQRVRVPMQSDIDSLNAAVAASLALFSYRSQHLL